jgi:mRNA-degrading endonuclease RelE of RelBE toxin-antitoxin system
MRLRFAERADKDYAGLPLTIRKAFAKQLRFLPSNLRHPSLQAKKYGAVDNLWPARVTRD